MTTEARPQALPVQADNIPHELRECPQFVLWRYEYRPDSKSLWTKVPYQVNGRRASSTNPDTWATFEAVLEALLAYPGRFDGIGFVLSPDDPFIGVDLDHCREPGDGSVEPWAQDIVDRLDSCTEITPSGTGLRIFVQGKLPPEGRKRGNFEVYESGRFLTITGHHLEGTPSEICERQAELEAIHREQFSQPQPSAPAPAPQPCDLPDSDILDRMFKSRNGDRVRRLWNGDWSGYPSQSEADQALCNNLVFWTGGNPTRVDELFRKSGLYREKWDEKHGAGTYGAMTISKALEGTTEFYQPVRAATNGHHTNGHEQISETLIVKNAEGDTAGEIPALPDDVWTGWLADYRDWVLPTTDGAIEGVFGAASVQLGLAIGRNISVHYGVPTFANLFVALCGPTGTPRKTTLINRSQSLQERAFTGDFIRTVRSVGSGEGLLERFCKEVEEGEGKNRRTVLQPIPGQRVLLDEPELTNLLKKMRRPGTANIAEILLGLFDGADYSPNTRRRPIVVQEPFFSIITATTPEALESTLNDVDIDSGLVPRIATFWCTPREPIAWPPPPDQTKLSELASALQDVGRFAGELRQHDPVMQLSEAARHEWESIYRDMVKESREAPKAVAGIMARVPTMVMKWALLYAAQAFHSVIEVGDLARGVMVGDYLLHTARLVPRHVEKTPVARIEARILEGMAKAPDMWWRPKDIHQKVGGRISAPELRRSLESLAALGKLDTAQSETGRTQVYRLAQG